MGFRSLIAGLALCCCASSKDGVVEHIFAIECNTFGKGEQIRQSLIFRDADASIVDWRWYSEKHHVPHRLPNGKYMLIWEDIGGIQRQVIADFIYSTRSNHDRELTERDILPNEQRRKLRVR